MLICFCLTGELSTTLCKAAARILDLSSNSFSGAIPHCMGDLAKNLVILDLHENQLQGTIPTTFTKSCQLTTFNLNNNHMEGSIPLALANCELLQILDLGNNKISDTFPPWLVTLRKLQVLVLRSNRLHGMLNVSNMKDPFPKLRVIDLSHNQFEGNVANSFLDNFKVMADSDPFIGVNTTLVEGKYYEASVNLIVKGVELEVKKILNIYTSIDLSCNKFNGTIPQVIGELKLLRLLNLSHNSLIGHIPSLLGNMSLLESLDLSSNQLEGTIPWQLTSLTFLSTLNLSENHLSGEFPRGKQLNTFGKDSFLGNSALCGVPLTKKCRDDGVPTPVITDDEEEDWFDPKTILIGYAGGLVCGLSTGYIVFTTLKPIRFVIFIERAQQKLIRRYL